MNEPMFARRVATVLIAESNASSATSVDDPVMSTAPRPKDEDEAFDKFKVTL